MTSVKGSHEFVVLGIDPGLSSTGYGIVAYHGNSIRAIDYGIIKTRRPDPLAARISHIFQTLSDLIAKFDPDEVAMEDIIYANNIKVALTLGYAGGASMLAAAQFGKEVTQYAPREIKMAITGNGSASKQQVKRMILSLVDLPENEIGYDISDALSVAVCHCYRRRR